MVDAFTYQKGSESRTFSSRKELYDYMVEQGEVIIEGEDAPKFKDHVDKRAASAEKTKLKDQAVKAKARLEE